MKSKQAKAILAERKFWLKLQETIVERKAANQSLNTAIQSKLGAIKDLKEKHLLEVLNEVFGFKKKEKVKELKVFFENLDLISAIINKHVSHVDLLLLANILERIKDTSLQQEPAPPVSGNLYPSLPKEPDVQETLKRLLIEQQLKVIGMYRELAEVKEYWNNQGIVRNHLDFIKRIDELLNEARLRAVREAAQTSISTHADLKAQLNSDSPKYNLPEGNANIKFAFSVSSDEFRIEFSGEGIDDEQLISFFEKTLPASCKYDAKNVYCPEDWSRIWHVDSGSGFLFFCYPKAVMSNYSVITIFNAFLKPLNLSVTKTTKKISGNISGLPDKAYWTFVEKGDLIISSMPRLLACIQSFLDKIKQSVHARNTTFRDKHSPGSSGIQMLFRRVNSNSVKTTSSTTTVAVRP